MAAIENIPACFYLGRKYDLSKRESLDEPLQYEAKWLTTHALCVGMTGSGKTGLCLSLIEEAALDGIPVLCIDPKGDLGNLLLTFPDLAASDFLPWIDPAEAAANWKPNGIDENDATEAQKIQSAAENAAATWRKGLEQWGLNRDWLQKLKDVEKTIYTPGSTVGVPLTVLKSFDAPDESLRMDAELFREQVASSASGLLSLLGILGDPLTSKEHILISNILAHAWDKGEDVSMEDLIRRIQSPPIPKIGVLDLESFFPTAERAKLAMSLNNLLASPSFAGWLQGQSLNIRELLYDAKGKAKVSVISIAHLNDAERMFFVTILLNELLSWMRSQPGTSALRAIFYMDEVYGYFPPSSKPPSKGPMMTLLKQARAFGLGIVLATQNPVDLDYKGLSNMGTWFLGRLQTQRDKDRVLDGLEGASAQQGKSFDRSEMDRILSALGKRVFLMNNVHENAPDIFQTRFALSYLRGPLSRGEVSRLMQGQRDSILQKEKRDSDALAGEPVASREVKRSVSKSTSGARPIVPAGIEERLLDSPRALRADHSGVLRPALLATASIHFVRAASSVDLWKDLQLLVHVDDGVAEHVWDQAISLSLDDLQFAKEPPDGFAFADLPPELLSLKNYKAWEKELSEHLFRHEKCVVYSCKVIKQTTAPGLDELDARMQLSDAAREARDQAMEKMRSKYDEKLRTFQIKVLAAQQRLDRHVEEAKAKRMDGLVNIGTSILGALLGGRRRSVSSSAVRDLTNVGGKKSEIERAQVSLEELILQKDELERECQRELDEIERKFSIENLELVATEIPLRKSDTKIKQLALAWIPWEIDANGIASPIQNWST